MLFWSGTVMAQLFAKDSIECSLSFAWFIENNCVSLQHSPVFPFSKDTAHWLLGFSFLIRYKMFPCFWVVFEEWNGPSELPLKGMIHNSNPIITSFLSAKQYMLIVVLMTLINKNPMGSTIVSSSQLLQEIENFY